jgi:LPXTG-motif cell wall-anchored protein
MQFRIIRNAFILLILFQVGFVPSTLVSDISSRLNLHSLTSHEAVLESFTSEVINLDCVTGQMLSGQFEIFCDGRLYPGDDQRYDDWMLESIQFYIFNQTEYNNYANGLNFTPNFQRNAQKLSWQFEVVLTGKWYVVFYNPSIYLITVQWHIEEGDSDNFVIVLMGLTISLLAISTIFYIKRRKIES